MIDNKLAEQLAQALEIIRQCGVEDARVAIDSGRVFQYKTKNGVVELLKESHSQSLQMRLFNKGHSGGFSTSDLRPEALREFVAKAAQMVELTDENPAYSLPPDDRTKPLPTVDLQQYDAELAASKKEAAQEICAAITAGARSVAPDLILVDASFNEVHAKSIMGTTRGFRGFQEATYISLSTEVNVQDEGGKKQNGWDGAVWFKYRDLQNPSQLGQNAAQKALDMIGCKPIETGNYPVIIDKYSGGKIIGWLLETLSGSNLYRQMSCLKDKMNQPIAPAILSIRDNPLAPGGLASAYYDEEGMVCEPRPLIEGGVLKNFYISNYWANKLGCRPTTASASNLYFDLGNRSGEAMAESAGRAIFITDFLGGNFNPVTGDFSTGIRGFLYENGVRKAPVSEMNLAGNLLELLNKLEELGNDPCPYDAICCPAMRFAPLMIAGL